MATSMNKVLMGVTPSTTNFVFMASMSNERNEGDNLDLVPSVITSDAPFRSNESTATISPRLTTPNTKTDSCKSMKDVCSELSVLHSLYRLYSGQPVGPYSTMISHDEFTENLLRLVPPVSSTETTELEGSENVSDDFQTAESRKNELLAKYIDRMRVYEQVRKRNLYLQDKSYQLGIRKGHIAEIINKRNVKRKLEHLRHRKRTHERSHSRLHSLLALNKLDESTETDALHYFKEDQLNKKYDKVIEHVLQLQLYDKSCNEADEKRMLELKQRLQEAQERQERTFTQFLAKFTECSNASVSSKTGRKLSEKETNAYAQDVTVLCVKLRETIRQFYTHWHGLNLTVHELEADSNEPSLNLLQYDHLKGENEMLRSRNDRLVDDIGTMEVKVADSLHKLAHMREKCTHMDTQLRSGSVLLKSKEKSLTELACRMNSAESQIQREMLSRREMSAQTHLLENQKLFRDYEETENKVTVLMKQRSHIKNSIWASNINLTQLERMIRRTSTHINKPTAFGFNPKEFDEKTNRMSERERRWIDGADEKMKCNLRHLLQIRNFSSQREAVFQVPMKLSSKLTSNVAYAPRVL